jgi:hypothetical protein
MPALAQKASVSGKVVDAYTGAPISGASVTLSAAGTKVVTGLSGDFLIVAAQPGQQVIMVNANGYRSSERSVELFNNQTVDAGTITLANNDLLTDYYDEQNDLLFDEAALDDEESSSQSIAALTGASDNIYYNASNYDFSLMYFRMRGYDRSYEQTSINGIALNDLCRGQFNYSSLAGLNRAFRNKTVAVGLAPSSSTFGDLGSSTDINTVATDYAPGFYGSVAYTNSSYWLRAMALYSTGLNKHGWAVTVGGIGRYADEGYIPGTFYNSGGLFLSVAKVLNQANTLSLTAFSDLTQRATGSASTDEERELTGDNLYNPNWGWQDGKKRSAAIVETFNPTVLLNWLYQPSRNTKLNTGLAFRSVNYSKSRLGYYNVSNPMPNYYRNLPSYYASSDASTADLLTDLWQNDQSVSQINWSNLYAANYANNLYNADPANKDNQRSATYYLEDNHSNQINLILSSTLNHRFTSAFSLQGGVSVNYTKASYYKTIRDLLGAEFMYDKDMYTEGNYPENPDIAYNDVLNKDVKRYVGDKIDYWYDLNVIKAGAWLQNTINTAHWDVNYALQMSHTGFYRYGHMQNGRYLTTSYGKGKGHSFDNAAIKAGATYKIDGRNFFAINGEYGTRAPLLDRAYSAPRYSDGLASGLTSERVASVDLSYIWNYRQFRGTITGFYTDVDNGTERSSFFDDIFGSYMNYTLTGVRKTYKGIEIGMALKVTPSVTISFAGTLADYRYKNNPLGTRTYDNGTLPDTTQTVYLKNYHVSGTPEHAANLGIDWAAPHGWYFNVNGTFMSHSYVSLAYVRHEAMPDLWQTFPSEEALSAKIAELAEQQRLKDAFVLNASVGKSIYINRKVTINLNLNLNNILNNKNIQMSGYQQGRMDTTNFTTTKFPNKYTYAQGFRLSFTAGIRF